MIDWHKIDNKIFEDIAYEYMTNNYPDLIWQKTKQTNDGNKDGEGMIFNLPFDTTIKYWYEAKYSINIDRSIPKSHLDSTLVSSLLDGHVVVIAFITNAYISDDYKRRADIFAKRRDNMKIYYINGEKIEDWLSDNPQIEARYFKTHNAKKIIFTDKIEEICFLDKYNSDNNQFMKLSTIELNKEYLLYIRFNSSINQKLELVSDNAIVFLQEYTNVNVNPAYISAEKGNNAFFIPVKITLVQEKYFLCIKGEKNVENHIISYIKVLDLYKPKLVITSQINLLNDINLFIQSNDFQNLIFWVIGEAGTGKTYTLNMLRNNVKNPFASISLNFSGNTENDCIVCYKLFIYCQFGNVWELDIENLVRMNFHPIVKDVLTEINIGVSSTATHKKLIEYCAKSTDGYIEQNFLQQQIYIDDIHKISSEVAYLLHAILEWCNNQRLNKRIFLFSRNTLSKFECLNEFLRINTCLIREIGQPSFEDVKSSIELNFGDAHSLISLVQSYQQSFNALYLYDFLCALKENIHRIKELDVINASVEISKIMNGLNYAEKNKIAKQLLKVYGTNIVFNFVYKLENGVDICSLIDFFGDSIYTEISKLCKKRIIKEIAGKLYPFHDILLEGFQKKRNSTYIEKIGEFILFCIEKNYFSQSEGYSHLVALGGKYFWKYRSIVKEFRDQLHESGNYFAAAKIAQKIHEENHKDLFDYDYEDIRNLFVLGNCYKYTMSYELSNQIFEKIKNVYRVSTMNLSDDVLLETYSETINNNLWMLNLKEADLDLKKMYQMLKFNDNIQNKSKTYKYGYLNYYNRRMFCNFMLGNGSEDDYKIALSKAKQLGLKEYEGFAHMDYAKSIYNVDILKAIKLLEKAKLIFREKGEIRRLLDVSSELVFINVLQSKSYDTCKLEKIYRTMQEKKYIQSCTRTYLKIIVAMLLSENYTAIDIIEKINNILVKNTSISSGKRHQALVYHVLAAIYFKDGNLKQSIDYSQKSLELFDELGNSYKKIHRHNTQIKKKGNIILGYEQNSAISINNFILDARIW